MKLFVLAGLLVTLALAVLVSPFASSSPDGLEKVSVDQGFDDRADDHDLSASPLADYGLRGVDNKKLATGVAGLVGVLVTFGAGLAVFALVRSLHTRSGTGNDGPSTPGSST